MEQINIDVIQAQMLFWLLDKPNNFMKRIEKEGLKFENVLKTIPEYRRFNFEQEARHYGYVPTVMHESPWLEQQLNLVYADLLRIYGITTIVPASLRKTPYGTVLSTIILPASITGITTCEAIWLAVSWALWRAEWLGLDVSVSVERLLHLKTPRIPEETAREYDAQASQVDCDPMFKKTTRHEDLIEQYKKTL